MNKCIALLVCIIIASIPNYLQSSESPTLEIMQSNAALNAASTASIVYAEYIESMSLRKFVEEVLTEKQRAVFSMLLSRSPNPFELFAHSLFFESLELGQQHILEGWLKKTLESRNPQDGIKSDCIIQTTAHMRYSISGVLEALKKYKTKQQSSLATTLSSSDNSIARITSTLNTSKETIQETSALERDAKEQKEIHLLREELRASTTQLDTVIRKQKAVQFAAKKELDKKSKEAEGLREELAAAQKQISMLQTQRDAMCRQRDDALTELGQAKEAVTVLQNELVITQAEYDEKQHQLEQVKKQRNEFEARLSEQIKTAK